MNWLNKQIQKNPQKFFIQENKCTYSIMDIAEMVQIYSQAFLREEIQPHDKVLIYLPNSIEMIEIILSCFEIGAIVVPISQGFTLRELQSVITNIQPDFIITNWENRETFLHYSEPIAFIEELPNSSRGCAIFSNKYDKNIDDVCAIILTSGTTGIPKAVQLTYGNFEASCNNWNDFLQFKSEDQFLCCLPLHHIGGFAVVIRALIYGFSVNLVQSFHAKEVHHAIMANPVTIISLVPTMLKRLLNRGGGLEELKKLRYILLGGGPSSGMLLDICIHEKLPIVKVYGMTETCSGTFGLKLLEEPQSKFYAGRPFPGVKVWIKDDEIHVSGPVVMKGYLNEQETKGTHNSHDLGYLDDNDLLFLHIRRKDLIVSGGENINPMEVEECLMNINGIADVAVVGKDDEEWGQKVIAYVVHDSVPPPNELLDKELKKILSAYKIPKEYIQVSLIPRNELGKIVYEKIKSL